MQNPNKGIVRAVEVNSEVLDNIQDEFQRLVLEHGIRVHSFQEARGISGMKGLSGKVGLNPTHIWQFKLIFLSGSRRLLIQGRIAY